MVGLLCVGMACGPSVKRRFFCFPEWNDQNRVTSLVNNFNRKVVLLVVTQFIPPRNNVAKDPCDPCCNLTRNLNVSQVEAPGISDTAVLVPDDEIVLGHG